MYKIHHELINKLKKAKFKVFISHDRKENTIHKGGHASRGRTRVFLESENGDVCIGRSFCSVRDQFDYSKGIAVAMNDAIHKLSKIWGKETVRHIFK